ncbi:MAG: XdhC family protein [Methylovirgula sp.]|nr:XdhC family protein [Methylovirgula sp.]
MVVSDADILSAAQRWFEKGNGVALATVVETWGAAPRPVGSHLVVASDGAFLGSVSGGCVEAEVIEEALDAIKTGTPRLLEFGVADETAWRAGLSCGGRINVYVERIDAGQRDLLAALGAERDSRRAAILLTDLKSGAKRLLRAENLSQDFFRAELETRLRLGRSGLLTGGNIFALAQVPQIRLLILGASHIAQALAVMTRVLDFETIIIDPRGAFATPERFPGCAVIAEWPQDALPRLGLDPYTAVALLAHEPRIDDPSISAALTARCFYIGALGSRKTHTKRLDRLRAAGIAECDLARIHAPIGIDIGALSPGEIAVSILAELIAARSQKASRSEQAA